MDQSLEVLQSYRAEFLPLATPDAIRPLGSAGGLSGAEFWRLATPQGDLVLRRWPPEHRSIDALRLTHAVLHHAVGRGVNFVPAPLATIGGPSFIERFGTLWELAPWLPGTADYHQHPSPQRLAAALRALAQFHRAVADFRPAGERGFAHVDTAIAGAPAVRLRYERLDQLQRGGLEILRRAIEQPAPLQPLAQPSAHELQPLAAELLALVSRALPAARARLAPLLPVRLTIQPAIRDLWHDHVLFVGDRVTGLIDFGALQFDTPTTDIARLLGSLVGDDPTGWQHGLAAYASVAPLSDVEREAISALDRAGCVLAAANWLRWIYLDRRTFANAAQVETRLRQLVARLAHHAAPGAGTC